MSKQTEPDSSFQLAKDFSLAAAGFPELPAANDPNLRWVGSRKEAVVLHILDQDHGQLKTIENAVSHYRLTGLSPEEITNWIERYTLSNGTRRSLKALDVSLRHSTVLSEQNQSLDL